MNFKEMESNGSKRPTKEQFWPEIDVSMFVTATIFYALEVSIKLLQINFQIVQLSYLFKLIFMQKADIYVDLLVLPMIYRFMLNQ